jgi:membrane protein implicated in regulation of membrane protease activity
MNKRVFAWILLIAFVLLLLNILVFRVYWELFIIVYIIIVVAFILSGGKLFRQDESKDNHEDNERDDHKDKDKSE